MKLIIAVIQPEELPYIKEELLKRQIYKFTVTNAKGQGKEIPVQEVYRGISYEISLLKKVRLEIAVNNEYVDAVIEASQPLPKKMAIKVVGRYLYYRLRNVFVSGLVKEVLLRSDENFIPIILVSH